MTWTRLLGASGVFMGLLLAGCAIPAVPADTPTPPVVDPSVTQPSDAQIALARELAEDIRSGASGKASMTVTTYADFQRVVEPDVRQADDILRPEALVVVVALDGAVDTASIKWHPNGGSIPASQGAIVAADESGRVISRFVKFASTAGKGQQWSAGDVISGLRSQIVQLP